MFVEQLLSGGLTLITLIQILVLGIDASIIYGSICMGRDLWRGFRILYAIRQQPLQPVEEESPPHHIQSEEFDEKMLQLGLTLIGRVKDNATDTDMPTRCYINDAATVYALAEMGNQFPEGILFGSRFADDSMVVTLAPNGTKITTDKYAFAFALNWAKAYEYHVQQIAAWSQSHGNAISSPTIREVAETHYFWETHYRRKCMARFIRLSLTSISLTVLISLIAAGMIITTLARVDYSYLIPVIVMMGILRLIRRVNRSWVIPSQAVDYQM